MKIEMNNTCISQTGLNFDTTLVKVNIHPTLHFRRNGFWRQMAVVFLKHSFDLKTPKILRNPDKTGFSGKSGTLSGPIRPDFSSKNPVCPEIPASLLKTFIDRGMPFHSWSRRLAFLLCALKTFINPGIPCQNWSRSMAFFLCALQTFINPGIPCHSWSRSVAFLQCALQTCIDPGMPFHSWSRSMAFLLCALKIFINLGIPCHNWSRNVAFLPCAL